MKKLFKSVSYKGLVIIIFILFLTGNGYAQTTVQGKLSEAQDTISRSDIQGYIESLGLSYPLATERLYKRNGYSSIWFSGAASDKFWEAMLLLDCSVQFGLNHHDYHAGELTYNNLKTVASKNDVNLAAKLDVLLTDAMLAFISHLHYGKLAPAYTAAITDQAGFKGFRADSTLISALSSSGFSRLITSAQPENQEYRDLQDMLRLITGQYVGDSYQTSIENVKLIALNMERWRWEKPISEPYVSVNIPAFNLRYNHNGQYQQFKVIVGKPSTPTPLLASTIGFFTTAPDWTVPKNILVKELLPAALKNPGYLDNNNFRIYDKKGNTINTDPESLNRVKANIDNYVVRQSPGCDNALGKIAFNFPNNYSVYLHDTPDRSLFNRSERAFSHGCIRLENPGEFARLLLKADAAPEKTFTELHQAMDNYQRKRLTLKTPVPILIRYFTCEMADGMLVVYKDLYKKDKEISDRLFESEEIFITEIKEFIKKKAGGFGNRISPVAQK